MHLETGEKVGGNEKEKTQLKMVWKQRIEANRLTKLELTKARNSGIVSGAFCMTSGNGELCLIAWAYGTIFALKYDIYFSSLTTHPSGGRSPVKL